MSTLYYLRRPMSEAEFGEVSGWGLGRTTEDGEWWTDGTYWVLLNRDVNGNIEGFERFGKNYVAKLAEATNAVSEHAIDDPDFAKLFDEEYEG